MKHLVALAAVLLASSAAYAGDTYSFDIGGRTVTIEAPRDCRSTDCISVSIPGVYQYGTKRGKRERDYSASDPAPIAPKPEATAKPAEGPKPVAAPAPLDAVSSPPPTPERAAKAPSSTVIANTSSADAATTGQDAPAPVTPSAAASPLGIWMTEKKEGKIRIEQCGANLCGYSVNAKTDANGDKVLINMKPGSNKWTGRIVDPNSGSTYDPTITLKGADSLRV